MAQSPFAVQQIGINAIRELDFSTFITLKSPPKHASLLNSWQSLVLKKRLLSLLFESRHWFVEEVVHELCLSLYFLIFFLNKTFLFSGEISGKHFIFTHLDTGWTRKIM
jgi:hypothetical protein